MITTINDSYAEQIEPRLLQQYREDAGFTAIMRTVGRQTDDLEHTMATMEGSFALDTAVGDQLDILGSRLGLARGSDDDATFRARIQSAPDYRTNGTGEDIIRALVDQYGATTVELHPEYPAGMAIFHDATVSQQQLNAISPAGVRVGSARRMDDGAGNPLVDGQGRRLYGF